MAKELKYYDNEPIVVEYARNLIGLKVVENDDGTVDLVIGDGGGVTPKGYTVTFNTQSAHSKSNYYYTIDGNEQEINIDEPQTLSNVSKISFRVEKIDTYNPDMICNDIGLNIIGNESSQEFTLTKDIEVILGNGAHSGGGSDIN